MQAVVFGRPSRRRRDRILQAAAADANRRAPHGIARERDPCRGRDRLVRFSRHVHLLGERGRELQLERDRQGISDGQRLHDRLERRRFRLQRVAADRHVGDSELSVRRRDGRHGVAKLIEQRDLRRWSMDAPFGPTTVPTIVPC